MAMLNLDSDGAGHDHHHVISDVLAMLRASTAQEGGLEWHWETERRSQWEAIEHQVFDVRSTYRVIKTPFSYDYGFVVSEYRRPRFERLAPAVQAALNIDRGVMIYRRGGTHYIRIERDDVDPSEAIVTYDEAMELGPELPDSHSLLGVSYTIDGPVQELFNWRGEDPPHPHLAIYALTGAGKTIAMRVAALTAMLSGMYVGLFDRKNRPESQLLAQHPQVWGNRVIVKPADYLNALHAVMERDWSANPILLLVDELSYTSRYEPRILDAVAAVAEAGREQGVHLLISAQRATVKNVGSDAKGLIVARLVGMTADAQGIYQAMGRGGMNSSGLDRPGAFVLVGAGDDTVVLQVPWLSPNRLAQAVDEARQVQVPGAGPLQPLPPQVQPAPVDMPEPVPAPTYTPPPPPPPEDQPIEPQILPVRGSERYAGVHPRVVRQVRQLWQVAISEKGDKAKPPSLNRIDELNRTTMGKGLGRDTQKALLNAIADELGRPRPWAEGGG